MREHHMSIFDRLKDKATGMMGGDKAEGKGKADDMVDQAKDKTKEMGDQAKEAMDKHRPDS